MLQQMDDPETFANLLGHLAKNKAVASDGVLNEILQALPAMLKQAIQHLFVPHESCGCPIIRQMHGRRA